jgi:AraC-like DNA-binding protein
MEANFSYNLGLEDFARLSHRSLSTFKRDFRKYYNQSPGKWLLQKRLDYSAVLLKNPMLNVSQVAVDCGFEDLSHFSRAFKEKFGISPADYRKETPDRAVSQVIEKTSCRLLKRSRGEAREDRKAKAYSCTLMGNRSSATKPRALFGRLSQLAQKAYARRARMGERRHTHAVRCSESIGAQRIRWAFSATCPRKSRSVKHLAS